MNKDQDHIDELFKAKLSHREFVIPDAFVNDMNQKIDAKKNKLFFWLFITATFTLGLGLIFFLHTPQTIQFNDINQDLISKNNISNNHEKNVLTNTELNNSSHQNRTLKTFTYDSSNMKHNRDSSKSENTNWYTVNEHDLSPITKSSKNVVHNSSSSTTESIENNQKINSTQYSNKNTDDQDASKNSDNKTIKSTNTANQNKQLNTHLSNTKSTQNDLSKNENNNDDNKKSDLTSSQIDNSINTNDNSETTETNKNENPLKTKPVEYSEIYISPSGDSIRIIDSIRYIDSVIVKDSIVIRDSIRIVDSLITENDTKKDFQMELQLFGGYEFSKPFYKPKNFISSDQEQGVGNINTGILFNVYYKNITAGTGVEYQTTGEKYSYTTITSSSYDSIVISYDSIPIFDTSGNQVGVQVNTTTDTINIPTSSQSTVEGKNKYNWVNIPIRFGYRFNINSWAIIPRVGLNFIFGVANDNSDYFNPTLNDIENIPTNTFAMSYHFELEIRKSFNQVHIFLKPHFNGMFTPTHETSSYIRRYSSFGGQVGIGFHF